MHEDPQIPNYGEPGRGPELEPGMVLAIEPMVNAGGPEVRMGDDNWAVYSADGSLAAHFEFTVAVTEDGPRILTPGTRTERPRRPGRDPAHRRPPPDTNPVKPGAGVAPDHETRGSGCAGSQLRERLAALAAGAACLAALAAARTRAGSGRALRGERRRRLPQRPSRPARRASTTPPTWALLHPGRRSAALDDQQPLYDGLLAAEPGLRGRGHPRLQGRDLRRAGGDVESTMTPRPGVTIIRDRGYGVPHIYGDTRADAMFGAGYANAADRLFLMDVLRNTGRAQLSSFIGGAPSNRAMDRDQWQFAPYTEADLQASSTSRTTFYGVEGRQLQRDVQAYMRGINAYIGRRARRPRTLLPAEYAALGKMPDAEDGRRATWSPRRR